MRVLHTADWHLGDRLGRIDRTDDLRRAVERIADYCDLATIDVLLVAGDLFSELARPDGLRDAIRHLQETFGPFLHRGGTILAPTGNHDNENFCQTLWHAMSLAAPASEAHGRAEPGRLHLATGPELLRLADPREGFDAQFVLMPYPTPIRYLHDQPQQRYASLEEKNRHLMDGFTARLKAFQADARFDPNAPTVLSAHIAVQGGIVSPLFRITEQEDVVFANADIPSGFAYVALGHIHKPQCIGDMDHVRYSGSIERLDLGEKGDAKSAIVFDLGPDGRRGAIELLPLDATPIYEVDIVRPNEQLPTLAARFPDAERDLVNLHITYTAGVDNLEEVLRECEKVFPRWYGRDWKEAGELGPPLTVGEADRGLSFAETVRGYLGSELANHAADERSAILDRAERLLKELG